MVNIVGVFFLCGLALISAVQSQEEDVLKSFVAELTKDFQDFTFNNFEAIDSELPTEEDQLCLQDLAALTAGLQRGQMWALKMMDSWGSNPSGLLTGNVYDLGNFDECLNVRREVSQNRTLQGKYCFRSVYLFARSATCIPASCSAVHMKNYVGQLAKLSPKSGLPTNGITISDSSCQTSESIPWDGLTIFMVTTLSVLGSLVALFTLWDYFLVSNQDQLSAVVKVFSARVNSRALFRVVEIKSNPNVIDCLNGIRCMSVMWVLYCHQFMMDITAANINMFSVKTCLAHSWYLSVDMQLFLISPLLLIALYKWGKKAAAGIFVLILLLSACLFATMMVNDYSMTLKNFSTDSMKHIYFATHTHATPWLIGFLFGYFLHLNKGKKFQLNWIAVWAGWILCLAMIFTSIYAPYPAAQKGAPALTTLENSFYYTLTRLGWSMALCWVVFACMQGYGGLANSFLSYPLWQPLSRLSYAVYMWHIFVQEVNSKSIRTNSYLSAYRTMLNFWSTFGFTLLFSYLTYLLIEAPFSRLDLLMPPRRKNPPVVKQKSHIDDNEISCVEKANVTLSTTDVDQGPK
ncbi:hypothetical protein M5D96_007605 [Drosophila gunungcola]|uniref:Nose resistant-to-fluoxetine protein N-terminal domain-containing protein n=1 Tax=Drosophila gunungcola TaxID=103775 RepID=A0A9Q0BQH8_9MUSC|nr:hypothetical protein M5D96_007605 [Drosophila gunungcola]